VPVALVTQAVTAELAELAEQVEQAASDVFPL